MAPPYVLIEVISSAVMGIQPDAHVALMRGRRSKPIIGNAQAMSYQRLRRLSDGLGDFSFAVVCVVNEHLQQVLHSAPLRSHGPRPN